MPDTPNQSQGGTILPPEMLYSTLMKIVGDIGAQGATLHEIKSDVGDLQSEVTKTFATLQERVGKIEVGAGLRDERLKKNQEDLILLRKELADYKHETEIALTKERNDRLLVRGAMMGVAMLWPVIWQFVIEPILRIKQP